LVLEVGNFWDNFHQIIFKFVSPFHDTCQNYRSLWV
jgi:hypothetical protein